MITEPLEFEKPIVNLERQLSELRDRAADSEIDMSSEMKRIEDKLTKTKTDIYRNLSSWQRVQIARHQQRPFMLDYVEHSFDDFLELHGDRHFGDDEAMPGGFAYLEGRKVMVIGHQKGRDTKENLRRNFGSAHPEGYRKALRLMRMAEKFNIPIVTLIDTPGAYPGIEAEERNIAEAIAYNLREMMMIKVAIVAVVIGEGGSGGALGIGVADRLLMFEHSVYTVASPEACASILWRDAAKAPDAAAALKITGRDLLELGVVDEVLDEPSGGNNWAPLEAGQTLRAALERHLSELLMLSEQELRDARYTKFRAMGRFAEEMSQEFEDIA